MVIEKKDGKYIINRGNATPVILSCNEVSLLVNFVGREGLKSQITDRLDFSIENEDLDMNKYDGTREEFEEEIFEALVDEIDYGNSVSDDDIDDKIADYADSYGMLTY